MRSFILLFFFAFSTGVSYAQYLSRTLNKPLIPVHHMEAHALTARMVEQVRLKLKGHSKTLLHTINLYSSFKIDFPFMVMLVSGGHCLIAIAQVMIFIHQTKFVIGFAPEIIGQLIRCFFFRTSISFLCWANLKITLLVKSLIKLLEGWDFIRSELISEIPLVSNHSLFAHFQTDWHPSKWLTSLFIGGKAVEIIAKEGNGNPLAYLVPLALSNERFEKHNFY